MIMHVCRILCLQPMNYNSSSPGNYGGPPGSAGPPGPGTPIMPSPQGDLLESIG